MSKADKQKLEMMLRELMEAAYEAGCSTDIYTSVFAIADEFRLNRRIISGDESP